MKKRWISMLLAACMLLALATGCSGKTEKGPGGGEPSASPSGEGEADGNKEQTPYGLNARGSVTLKATGMCTYSFEEEQDEAWADAVTDVYVREMPDDPAAEELADSDKIDIMKYTVSSTKVILDSDLFPVEASSEKEFEVTIKSEGYDDYHLGLTIKNLQPTDFTIRTIDGNGNVVSSHVFTYEEMDALCTTDAYYSAGCVMHGMFSNHGRGVLLTDLLNEAGVEFTEGMSIAMRTADAPATIEATETNSSVKTGVVFDNPESYWIKARFTDNYKMTYENLMGRTRYFVSAPWDNAEIGEILTADGSDWSLDARIALAESGLIEETAGPMIAIQYDTLQYSNDSSDIRTTNTEMWELTPNEYGFAFFFGLAMDDDTAINVTAYDDELKAYPVVEDQAKAGLTALEEGPDACGTSTRNCRLVMGFDIFLEGGVS